MAFNQSFPSGMGFQRDHPKRDTDPLDIHNRILFFRGIGVVMDPLKPFDKKVSDVSRISSVRDDKMFAVDLFLAGFHVQVKAGRAKGTHKKVVIQVVLGRSIATWTG